MAIWFVASWSSEVQVIIWTWNWCLKWRMVLWNWALTCGIWFYLKILPELSWLLRHPVEPENCLLVWGSLHTHTHWNLVWEPLFSAKYTLGEWTRKGVCECLKYFLCWFFKVPITTVPPLRFKHYLQRPKWKPLTGERHHCFLYQFGGQILYKLIQLEGETI